MTNITMTPVTDSSQIKSIGYEDVDECLYIEFNRGGDTYRYSGVPADEYEKFLSSTSKGQYFHKNIKTQYHAVKIEATEKKQ